MGMEGGSALVLQLFRGLRSPVAVACSIILAPPPPSAPQPIPPPATIAQTHAAQSTPSSPRNRVALPRTPLGSISHISGNYSSSPRPPYKMRPVSNMEPTCAALSVPPPLHTSREDASMKLAAVLFLAALAVTGARLHDGSEKPKKEQVSVVSRCALGGVCGGGGEMPPTAAHAWCGMWHTSTERVVVRACVRACVKSGV